jgi:fructosamine-3-kinase
MSGGAVHYGWPEADLAMPTLFGPANLGAVRTALHGA